MKAAHEFFIRWFDADVQLRRPRPWHYLLEQAQAVPWEEVADLAQRLDYEGHFLKTPYWRVIADHVKKRDSSTCRKCGREPGYTWLDCHHVSYTNLGSEHIHLDDLATLCRPCHLREHGFIPEALILDYKMSRLPLDDIMSEFVDTSRQTTSGNSSANSSRLYTDPQKKYQRFWEENG